MEISCRYGIFEIMSLNDLISKSLIEYGEWAQIEIDTLAKFIKPGDTVIDAGAYIGTHTIAFANIVGNSGRVIAFEPNPIAFRILENNCVRNSCSNVVLYPYALGNAEGQVSLFINTNNNVGGSCLLDVNKESNDRNHQIIVEQRRLDSILNDSLHFIKADVEGMELELLEGSENLIIKYKPVIFLELISLQNSVPILEWAKRFGYIVYGIISSAYNEKNYNSSTKNIFGEAKECGLLLIHLNKFYKYEDSLYILNLPKIETVDDLALLLLHKPQYPYEILSTSKAALKLGINYPSPKIGSLENELKLKDTNIKNLSNELTNKDSFIQELNSKMISLENKLESREVEIKSLSNELTNKDSFIEELNSKIISLENELISVLLSRSWRYTRPIRKILNRLRKIKKKVIGRTTGI
ncbi:FkbM family methyltransferase [Thermoanaerobacterium sp. RBIITD]|uniref:FkbM family methyltransferase n=1 Tax=Thermoanaerobacterium sp. RBIITD TaxID=1550240 RepID=UPI000BB8BCD7|nr:FkbM family methyltransferase [Thermoanaerobacterium sp. RBIITD]SNX52860.1 methyltransferase, FkbM family [Thermoanaerobacterium sp. RBIITD]